MQRRFISNKLEACLLYEHVLGLRKRIALGVISMADKRLHKCTGCRLISASAIQVCHTTFNKLKS